jgi:hypothetical protein
MKHGFFVFALALCALPIVAQDKVSTQSLQATFSNLDKEPPPYIPDPSLGYSASQDPRPNRPTLGAIADFQETYGLPVFSPQPPVYYPAYYPVYIGGFRSHVAHHSAPVGHNGHVGGGRRR